MSVKLLTEHHLGYLSLKGDCRGSFESTLCQNVKLLEISCHGSYHTDTNWWIVDSSEPSYMDLHNLV